MNCPDCHKKIEDLPPKISFREQCPHCGADLHSCVNCKFYSPGKPNDCLVPNTDYVKNRKTMNFCEEFQIQTIPSAPLDKNKIKNKFNSLFKDE